MIGFLAFIAFFAAFIAQIIKIIFHFAYNSLQSGTTSLIDFLFAFSPFFLGNTEEEKIEPKLKKIRRKIKNCLIVYYSGLAIFILSLLIFGT